MVSEAGFEPAPGYPGLGPQSGGLRAWLFAGVRGAGQRYVNHVADAGERPWTSADATKSVTRFGRSHKMNGFGFMADQIPKEQLW